MYLRCAAGPERSDRKRDSQVNGVVALEKDVKRLNGSGGMAVTQGRMKLVLTSDDLGVNASRTDGILAAANCISRASLLVNGEDSTRAARLAAASALSTGLHFNITEGSSYSPPGICVINGEFIGKVELLLLVSRAVHCNDVALQRRLREFVLCELEAQLQHFTKLTNQTSVWLDGHHHVHVLPVVYDAIVDFFHSPRGSRWHLTGMRLPDDPTLRWVPPETPVAIFQTPDDCMGMPFWRRISTLASAVDRTRLKGVLLPTAFFGFDTMGSACSVAALQKKVTEIRKHLRVPVKKALKCSCPPGLSPAGEGSWGDSDVVLELMTHVGFPHCKWTMTNNFFHDEFSVSTDRLNEFDVVMSKEFAQWLKEEDIQLLKLPAERMVTTVPLSSL